MGTSAWDEDVELSEGEPGVLHGAVSERWNAGTRPNGGYLMALGVRAMSLAGPYPDPFTATCHFLSAADVGPATFETSCVRQGRTLATVTGRMVQDGKPRTQLIGCFGRLADASGPSHRTLEPPDLPDPDDCLPALRSLPNGVGMAVTEHADIRYPRGASLAGDGHPSGTASVPAWFRLADGREPDPFVLFLAIDAFAPAVLELGIRGWSPTIELTAHVRALPAPGWLRVVRRTNVLWNSYFEEDCEVWDSSDTLVAQARQFARLGGPAVTADRR